LIEKIGGSNRYSVRNVRTNTCMEVAHGSSEDSAKVQGHQSNGRENQEWNIIGTDETGYRYDASLHRERVLNCVSFLLARC
jgi:Ricin-type beta-trefoil lectin domain-like